MIKVKDKKKILKTAREKQLLIHNEISIRLSTDSSEEILQATRNVMTYSKCCKEKKKKLPTKNSLPSKVVLKKWGD